MFRMLLVLTIAFALLFGFATSADAGQWRSHAGFWYWYGDAGQVYYYANGQYFLWNGVAWVPASFGAYATPYVAPSYVYPQFFYGRGFRFRDFDHHHHHDHHDGDTTPKTKPKP